MITMTWIENAVTGTENVRSTQHSPWREPRAESYATGIHGRGRAKNLLQSNGVTFLEVGEFAWLFLATVPVLRLFILPVVLLK